MKSVVSTFCLIALVSMVLVLGHAPLVAQSPHPIPANKTVNRPTPNPYLAGPLYAIAHFDSSQSDSTPYGPPRGTFSVDPATQPVVLGGPENIITLASTHPNYMWQVGTDRVSYVTKNAGRWTSVATYQALAAASEGTTNYFPPIPDENLRTFGESSAIGMTAAEMDGYLQNLLGANYAARDGNGAYSLVDRDNVLYANYSDTLYGFALTNPARPSDGITVRYKLPGVIKTFQGPNPSPNPRAPTRIFGLSMTYNGHLIVTFSNGMGVIDRNLNVASASFYPLPISEYVSNSIAVDENNGIYLATGWSGMPGTTPMSVMRKLVWTGTAISDNVNDGAWSSPYDNSAYELPPLIKWGVGTGSTPTLMGLGNDPDKLVVITDGAKQMKLVAFWRNQIPDGLTQRIAGQIPVTCGFNPLPTWVQSEQSVVVYGYGAFVVNNIPAVVSPDVQGVNRFVGVSLMGPAYPTSLGAERFQWDPSTHNWSSVWARSDVSSTSMIPVHSESANMALINGWGLDGWGVLGLDWNTGKTVHHTIFGQANFGNGAYAILQYLENQDLLFNSIAGPFRVHYGPGRAAFGED
jgi:hypothetical protein